MIRASSAWVTVRTTKSYESRHCLAPDSTGQATLQTHEMGPMPFVKGPYLLVQEQLRMDGLPLSLRQGTPQVAGTCQAWTGTYPDGQQWVAFMRHKAAVLISTNTLTGTQLLTYVGSLSHGVTLTCRTSTISQRIHTSTSEGP
jgi:hypothetical protein